MKASRLAVLQEAKSRSIPQARRGDIYAFMAAEHAQLDELLGKAGGESGAIRSEAYQRFREWLLRHIRIEEKILLPMAERKRGAPLSLAPRLRLDHGALAALLMLPPVDHAFRAIRAVLDAHNPLEEAEGGVYDECESLAGSEVAELLAQIAATPRVPVSSWVDSPKVLAAARRVLARAGHDPALLGPPEEVPMSDAIPEVIIVGGGFGGTNAAHALRHAGVRVTVIDRTNHSVFSPLLYQVATCGLSADEISAPIRFLLRRQLNAEVLMAEVTGFDLQTRTVEIGAKQLQYDYLIVATGTQYNYFGHDDWPRFAPSLKSVADAARIRHRILHAFERAELETDAESVHALLTFVLIGGGPTGVELAGALAELTRFTLRREYRHIDTRNTRILLVEAGPRILPGFADCLAKKALDELQRKGVEIMTSTAVTDIDQEGVLVNHQTRIDSRNVIWTAGVRATPIAGALGAETDYLGRVKVRPDLSVPGHPEVFVIGDIMVLEHNGQLFSPGLATVAIQQGTYVGDLLARRVAGRKEPPPFRYRDKGKLAAIGRSFAIADFRHIRFAGFFGWLLWWTVHIMYLAGLWNRLQVLSTWIWAYLTYQRSVRILTPESAILQEVNGRIPSGGGDAVPSTPATRPSAAPEGCHDRKREDSAARE